LPHTASTDLNVFNVNGPVFSLVETLTKLMALGIELPDVVAMGTTNAARAVGRASELGSISPGRPAELSVLRLRTDGPFPVSDGVDVIHSPMALEAVGCVRGGSWLATPPVPSFATIGKTWGDAPNDTDW
jgi:dihydroorotase